MNSEGDIWGASGGSGSLQSADSHNVYPGQEYLSSTGVGNQLNSNATNSADHMPDLSAF